MQCARRSSVSARKSEKVGSLHRFRVQKAVVILTLGKNLRWNWVVLEKQSLSTIGFGENYSFYHQAKAAAKNFAKSFEQAMAELRQEGVLERPLDFSISTV